MLTRRPLAATLCAIALCCATLLASAPPANAYGSQGHRTIARLAQERLNATARARIQNILGNTDLVALAMWPDELKQAKKGKGPLKNDPEAKAFNQKFPGNGGWHFVNLPLDTTAYQLNGPFSKPDDVVHIIEDCVRVLEGTSTRFTKRQALRFLVHLAGDIHQPLHVGCGYYRFDDDSNALIVTNPAEAVGLTHDTGGNVLFFSENDDGEPNQLHSFWDTALVERLTGSGGVTALANFLAQRVDNPDPSWSTPGTHRRWARHWATDSVTQSREVYRGLTFGQAFFEDDERLQEIETTLPPNYAANQRERAAAQLAKAGFRLKELLNRIQWQ
ncbi:MAG TPA: S1/P1 nuclease [Pyrinomonadaceae bacterium]|jgi:hypothetical protein|nr:S1/P1 nuclease [Pyrinomonadaceae bacterium]